MNIVELSDHNIRFSNSNETLIESPGFANIALGTPIFGDEARQQYRLHPRQSFNQFWSQLNLDPLANTNNLFRHQADLAYHHLNSLANSCELSGDVVFVIPGNYTRNQLAVLLGLAEKCSFTPKGLVDKAVLATANSTESDHLIYVDIQLHQAVLTSLKIIDGQLIRDSVLQIPGAGLLTLEDAWANMITDAFVSQSRFDPLHNAETEQFIYNQLPLWLNQSAQDNEVFMEINHKGTVHQASINRGHFEQRSKRIFALIKEEIGQLSSPQSNIYISDEFFTLPGLNIHLPDIVSLEPLSISRNAFENLEHLQQSDKAALSFITRLPVSNSATGEGLNAYSKSDGPSHILVNNKAFSLPVNTLYLGQAPDKKPSGKGTSFIEINDPAVKGMFTISNRSGDYVMEKNGNDSLLINGKPANDKEILQLGDRISMPNLADNLHLIRVQ